MRSHLVVRIANQLEPIAPLVRRTIAHEPGAWQELWLVLDPRIETIAGRWRVTGRLASSYDDRRAIVLRVFARLHADDFRRLRDLHDVLQDGEDAGRAWLSVVTRRDAFNYVRHHDERLGGTPEDGGARWAALVPLPEGGEELVPESVRTIPSVTAREILACAEEHLDPPQLLAVRLWLMGYEQEEMARALGVANGKAADALVRAGLAALRYRFAGRGAPRSSKNSF